jgi:maleylacetate reductase
MNYFQSTFDVSLPAVRVRFGPGISAELPDELDRISCGRALVLSTPGRESTASKFVNLLGYRAAGVYSKAAMHTPTNITAEAVAYARDINADSIVSIGGGSTIGLGKAIALYSGLPQLVIPTTHAGSEATGILGQTENGIKTTITDTKVQPNVVLYDAELVVSLPNSITVTSALNAIAHAAEALYARDRNPLSTSIAIEGIRAFKQALPKVLENPSDLDARGETLYGTWLCGLVLGQVGMSLHHKLCHTLGGSFDLPHAQTHAIVLPHALAYNASAVPELIAPICEIFGEEDAGKAIFDFAASLGAPSSLKSLGLVESELDRAAELATKSAYWNPRPVDREAIRALLQRAFDGAQPR